MAGSKGGKPGQWSARKAQLLAQEYKARGGGYSGSKTASQKSLSKWTKEKWGTKSGKPSTQGKEATGERYLPEAARKKLTKRRTSRASIQMARSCFRGRQRDCY